VRRAPSEFSITCPPSIPKREGIFPAPKTRRMSDALPANSSSSGYASMIRCAIRNVPFQQTVGLVQALRAQDVPFELIVFPDDVHDSLVYDRWLYAFGATEEFFDRVMLRGEAIKGEVNRFRRESARSLKPPPPRSRPRRSNRYRPHRHANRAGWPGWRPPPVCTARGRRRRRRTEAAPPPSCPAPASR
jgi:hypothetical protein